MTNSVYPVDPISGRAALGGKVKGRNLRLYIAGKIEKNDWRGRFVPGLRDMVGDYELYEQGYAALNQIVEIAPRLHYVGPFFVSCDHGCGHFGETHGVMGGCISSGNGAGPDAGRISCVNDHPHSPDCGCGDFYDVSARSHVARTCLEQVASADIIIALIADDAHGTLVEVGYALALDKPVYVTRRVDCGHDERPKALRIGHQSGAWFPFHSPGTSHQCCVKHTIEFISTPPPPPPQSEESRCESPVEIAFLRSMRKHGDLGVFHPNIAVMGGRYRIDFADTRRKIGIEIDGHKFHSDKETFAKDRIRQRELEKDGWRIVRYSGQEVHRDADGCVADLRTWLAATA